MKHDFQDNQGIKKGSIQCSTYEFCNMHTNHDHNIKLVMTKIWNLIPH